MKCSIKHYSIAAIVTAVTVLVFCSFRGKAPEKFYVDPQKGNDRNEGTIDKPFRSLDKALSVVGERVKAGQLSDKIFLRGGVYRKATSKTSYWLDLKGTPDDYAMISAMPCEPGAKGCVQRSSGKWYENVVFDDGQFIKGRWTRVEGHKGVWTTNPGYVRHEWTTQNLWPWRRTPAGFPVTNHDDTPATTLFTVAPYMLLQDGQPSIWADSVEALTKPGLHTYDHASGQLYIFPAGNKDPNKAEIETWYGGDEDYEEGILYLDGEGRGMFHGNMQYAAIVGCQFKMFIRLFEFQRRGYLHEKDREIQKYVKIEDNTFQYGWMHFLLDANTIYTADGERIHARFEDRSNWTVRYNLFYRPSREVFQVHGADHVFENNFVIDHVGPWAGPAACVAVLNARNMDNLQVRNNYIVGHGNTRYHPSSVFMMEVAGRDSDHSRNGDYIYKGPTYEHNLIANVAAGPTFVLGKGDVRMRDITIRNNIIATNVRGSAIQISSPQLNLKIENNIFYDQAQVITVFGKGSPMQNPPLPSSISMRNNIFSGNKSLIDPRLFETPEGSNIAIDHNLFAGADKVTGTNVVTSPVEFANPAQFDFTLPSKQAESIFGGGFGPDTEAVFLSQWKKVFEKCPAALPVGEDINGYNNK